MQDCTWTSFEMMNSAENKVSLASKVKIEIDVAEDVGLPPIPSSSLSEGPNNGSVNWKNSGPASGECFTSGVVVKKEPVSDSETVSNPDLLDESTLTPDFNEDKSRQFTEDGIGFEINFKSEPFPEWHEEPESTSSTVLDDHVQASSTTNTESRFHSVVKSEDAGNFQDVEPLGHKLSVGFRHALMDSYVNGTITDEQVNHVQHTSKTDGKQKDSSEKTLVRGKPSKEKRPFQCLKCPSAFHCLSHLKRHLMSHDQNYNERPFSCSTCNARFKLRCHLKQHIITHTGEKPYSCMECKATFARSDHLKQHTKSHLGLRPYLCTVCDMAFTQAGHLRKHMVRHRDDRVVFCKIKACKKVFTSVSELEKHRESHKEDRKCKECNTVLSRADDLKKHMRIHTKDKPYKCAACPARFTQPGHLSIHKMQHTGEKPYVCGLCSAGFKQSHHLRRHMEIHERDTNRPFSCKLCGASFYRCLSLTRHKQKCQRPSQSSAKTFVTLKTNVLEKVAVE